MRRSLTASLALIALNGAVLAYLYLARSRAPVLVKFGEVLPTLRLLDGAGKLHDLGADLAGKLGVVLYTHEPPWQKVFYVGTLMRRYAHHQPGLAAVLVLAPDAAQRLTELRRDLPFPVVLDSGGSVADTLELPRDSDATILVDPHGHVALSTPFLVDRDELRQHVEKHLLGTINYDLSPIRPVPQSSPFVVPVRDMLTDRRLDLRPAAGTTLIAFPAALCATCRSEPIYDRLATYLR
jgi:hypothetical protein